MQKGRNALVDLIWRLSEIGRYALFCLSIDEIFLHLKEQVIYNQKQWYLGFDSDHENFCTAPRGVLPLDIPATNILHISF